MRLFRIHKKAYMTILETLIAVSLLSILLVFAFGFFRELAGLSRISEIAQNETFQMRYLESRLAFIFERIVCETESSRKFFFYSQPPNKEFSNHSSLILTFDNEVRVNPSFSGDVLARLYVDLDHRLCLAIWPLHVPQPHGYLHEEVLLNHVANVNFSFYSPPPRAGSNKDVTEKQVDTEKKEPAKDKWLEEWFFTYEQMPAIVKIGVQVAEKPEDLKNNHTTTKMATKDYTFSFVLPSKRNPIYYPSS